MELLSRHTRARWNCGWIPEAERTGRERGELVSGVMLRSEVPHKPATCPGYTIRLPEVLEAERGRWWLEKGELRGRYDDQPPTPLLLDSIEVLEGEEGAVQRERWSGD